MAGGEECSRAFHGPGVWDEDSGHESRFHVFALGRAVERGKRWGVAEGCLKVLRKGPCQRSLRFADPQVHPPVPLLVPLCVFPPRPPCMNVSFSHACLSHPVPSSFSSQFYTPLSLSPPAAEGH